MCAWVCDSVCVLGGRRGHPPSAMLNRTIVERTGGVREMKCVGGGSDHEKVLDAFESLFSVWRQRSGREIFHSWQVCVSACVSRAGRGVDEGQELMRCSWTGGLEICYVTSSLGEKKGGEDWTKGGDEKIERMPWVQTEETLIFSLIPFSPLIPCSFYGMSSFQCPTFPVYALSYSSVDTFPPLQLTSHILRNTMFLCIKHLHSSPSTVYLFR